MAATRVNIFKCTNTSQTKRIMYENSHQIGAKDYFLKFIIRDYHLNYASNHHMTPFHIFPGKKKEIYTYNKVSNSFNLI